MNKKTQVTPVGIFLLVLSQQISQFMIAENVDADEYIKLAVNVIFAAICVILYLLVKSAQQWIEKTVEWVKEEPIDNEESTGQKTISNEEFPPNDIRHAI